MGLTVLAKLKAPINKFVRNGKEETFYKDVGSMVENDQGRQFLMMDKSLNLLAVAHNESSGSVPIYLEWTDKKPKTPEAPVKPSKTTKPKSEASVSSKAARRRNPTSAEVKAAKHLLMTDAMAKQNITKDGGHIDLPFDDEIGF